jgi:outer membrane receptor protein involved in Fe transport
VYNWPIDYGVASVESRIDGKIFDAPGGAARVAIGGQYRTETFDEQVMKTPLSGGPTSVPQNVRSSRRIASAYGEVLVPLVGDANAVPFVQKLRISISGRYDHYSEFGSTSNPKVALEWVPITGLAIHGSYSRSFQAPTLFEASTAIETGYVIPVPDPKALSGSTLSLISDGTDPNLQPETAKSFNVGFTYEPVIISGLKLDASYFSIDFKNQINRLSNVFFTDVLQQEAILGSLVERNPSVTQVNQILNQPGRIIFNYAGPGFTPAPYSPSDIQAIANIGYVNASGVSLKGVDLTAHYTGPSTSFGVFRTDFDGTFFTSYQQRITPSSSAASPLNTVYNPLRFRAKVNLGWQEREYGANLRLNYSPAYDNSVDPN